MKNNRTRLMYGNPARTEIQNTQAIINDMFGFTEELFINMLLDEGSAYLNEYFKNTPGTAGRMKKDVVFWNWWRNQWHIRNLQFLYDEGRIYISQDIQYYMYLTAHDGKNIASELHPQRIIYLYHLGTHKINQHADF